MLEEHLTNPRWWMGAVIVVAFFLFMWRFRPKPKAQPLEWDFCYDFVSESVGSANPELRGTFEEMLRDHAEPDLADAHLIRLAVMNRGSLRIEAAHHLRPLDIAFPKDARIVDARFVEIFGPAPDSPPEVTVYEHGLEIAPFDLPVNCALVFNIIVRGADMPSTVDGGIEGQPAIEKLQ